MIFVFYGLRCFVFVVCKIFYVSIVTVVRVDIEKILPEVLGVVHRGVMGFSVRGFVIWVNVKSE